MRKMSRNDKIKDALYDCKMALDEIQGGLNDLEDAFDNLTLLLENKKELTSNATMRKIRR